MTDRFPDIPVDPPPCPPVEVVRPSDLLVMRLSFENLMLRGGELARINDKAAAYVCITLPPQSVREEAVIDAESPPSAVPALLSAPTRFRFEVRKSVQTIPFTVAGLLDWDQFVPRGQEVELPARLVLSPAGGRWSHPGLPLGSLQRIELWHTRLTRLKDEPGRTVGPPLVDIAYREGLSSASGNWSLSDDKLKGIAENSVSGPVLPERLMLSALGGWLTVDASWPGKALRSWRHRTSMGRDTYVEVAELGRLLPFGHLALRTTTTERKLLTADDLGQAGYLIQRESITVLEPRRHFRNTGAKVDGEQLDRCFPFVSVEITTRFVGDVQPNNGKPFRTVARPADGSPVPFTVSLTDVSGNTVDAAVPMVFAELDNNGVMVDRSDAIGHYNGPVAKDIALGGRPVAWALETADRPGATTFAADSVRFCAVATDDGQGSALAGVLPKVASAKVVVPVLSRLAGAAGAREIAYTEPYRRGEEDPTTGVFAALTTDVKMDRGTRGSGGVAAPAPALGALSRTLGSVPRQLAEAQPPSDLAKLFPGKVLGFLSLEDIVTVSLSSVPEVVTIEHADGTVEDRFSWNSGLTSAEPFVSQGGGVLSVSVTDRAPAPGSGEAVRQDVEGELTNFALDLFGFISIPFTSLRFEAKHGAMPAVKAELGQMQFGGPLAFLNTLAAYVPFDGFSNPPSIDVDETGIRAGFSLGLPDVALGMWALQNIGFSSTLCLPFTGEPARARFAFAECHRPFLITVYGVTGGGYFGLAVGLDGVEAIEASLEFGGNISLSVVVASGGVRITGGTYFGWEQAGPKVTFRAFIRAVGALTFLGLVAITIEIYLGLEYVKVSGTAALWGRALVIVDVEAWPLSKTVSFPVERLLTGSPADPTFSEAFGGESLEWVDYCARFRGMLGTAEQAHV